MNNILKLGSLLLIVNFPFNLNLRDHDQTNHMKIQGIDNEEIKVVSYKAPPAIGPIEIEVIPWKSNRNVIPPELKKYRSRGRDSRTRVKNKTNRIYY